MVTTGGAKAIHALSAAPWGSASILLISYAYMKMLGCDGMTSATRYAILNANYLKSRLEPYFPVLSRLLSVDESDRHGLPEYLRPNRQRGHPDLRSLRPS